MFHVIHRILCVIAMVAIRTNYASDAWERFVQKAVGVTKAFAHLVAFQRDWPKKDLKEINEEFKEEIEWSWKFGVTKPVPIGVYFVYKEVGDEFKYQERFVADKKGLSLDLSNLGGFSLKETYVIYGVTHEKDMQFQKSKSGTGLNIIPTNVGDLDEEGLKFIRSAPKSCLKGLILIIVGAIAFVIACCGCCTFFWIKKRKMTKGEGVTTGKFTAANV